MADKEFASSASASTQQPPYRTTENDSTMRTPPVEVPVILRRGASAQNTFYNKVYKEQAAMHLIHAGDSTMRDLEFTVTGDTGAGLGMGGRRMSVAAMHVAGGAEGVAAPRRISVAAPQRTSRPRLSSMGTMNTGGTTDMDIDALGTGRMLAALHKLNPSPSGRSNGFSPAAADLSGPTGRDSVGETVGAAAMGERAPINGSRISFSEHVSRTLSRGHSRVNPLPTGGATGQKSIPRNQRVDWQISNLYELCHLRHSNVVRVFGGCSLDHVSFLVEEHMAFGPLCDLLALKAVSIETDTLVQIAMDIAHGCLYLHERNPPVVAMLTSRTVLISADLTAKVQLAFTADTDNVTTSSSSHTSPKGLQHVTIWRVPAQKRTAGHMFLSAADAPFTECCTCG